MLICGDEIGIAVISIQTVTLRLSARVVPITGARGAACPHIVEQHELSRETRCDLGFEEALQERREWIAENCIGEHLGQSLRDDGVITRRQLSFADPDDAFFPSEVLSPP